MNYLEFFVPLHFHLFNATEISNVNGFTFILFGITFTAGWKKSCEISQTTSTFIIYMIHSYHHERK